MTDERAPFGRPVIDTDDVEELSDGVWIIPDRDHTPLVPNVGIVVGERRTLVIDTGLGTSNARAVAGLARRLGEDRPVFVTHTHAHPEHGFGANAVHDDVTILCNLTQWHEVQEKGPVLLGVFRGLMPMLADMFEGIAFVRPHVMYTGYLQLDLGGDKLVEFHEVGGAHSRGDQVLLVVGEEPVLFTGDLVEEGLFSVLGDDESHARPWIDRLERLQSLGAHHVVPGHGHVGGPERIADTLAYFELARRRVSELHAAGELSEAKIIDRVTAELVDLNPTWRNREWARKTVEDFAWPARP
ncbi:MAG TPA: MBL fold metallo-hydrolase [Actinomycetes bacterium]|nr:MBL fold metallo-hydrolase [Actinomycetes bacterium]